MTYDLEELKKKMRELANNLTFVLTFTGTEIVQDECWEIWARVVDEYEKLGGFKK